MTNQRIVKIRVSRRAWSLVLPLCACIALVVLTAGCPMNKSLTLTFEGLEALGSDYVYEGWLIVDGAPVTTGRFTINDMGALSQDTFSLSTTNANTATAFVLTIEPAEGDDPAPAATHVLGGDIMQNMADLTIGHDAALGVDFLSASGTYILNTPSTASLADDFDQGIWWLDPAAGPGPSLVLPMLPDGWIYEGWVVGDAGPVSTGRFLSATGDDSDIGGMTAGPDGTPPFPGQDFIDPAMVLIGHAAVVSVEPEPDDSEAPFALKPLLDMNIEDVGIGVLQDMVNNVAASEPTGTASIS
jgi:hypothetical protein